jgi:hypothetical protein
MSDDTSDEALRALRTALAAEHAAVYLFAAFHARTAPGALADALLASYDFHRTARDLLIERLSALGDAEPAGAAPAYDLPGGLGSAAGVSAAALTVERTAAAGYADLVAATSGDDRALAVGWLSATAVRQLRFGGAPTTLPGLS